MSDNTFLLIDGNSLLFKAFYALPLLHTREGIYTNGVYGFLTMFNRVTAEVQPSHIAVAFDMDRKTFRNETYSEYKANRGETPDELVGQFKLLREVLAAMNVDYVELQGFEADDLIGTLSKQAEAAGMKTIILTGDGDALQLVSDCTRVYMSKKGITDMCVYDPAAVTDKWEVTPEQMIEIKALMGDSSDNIPGVPGVGSKTAIKLIKAYASLENLYEHIEEVNGKKLKENLLTYRDQAYLSRDLATIRRDVELEVGIDDFAVKEMNRAELSVLYKKLEFKGLLAALEQSRPETEPPLLMETQGHTSAVDIRELKTVAEVESFLAGPAHDRELAVHLETSYHHPMWAQGLKIYLAAGDEVAWLDMQAVPALAWLKEMLEDPQRLKYMHNAKSTQVFLLRSGIDLGGIKGDSLLLSYVLDASFQGETLVEVIAHYMNIDTNSLTEAEQAALIVPLYHRMEEELTDELRCLLYDVEMLLSGILAEMEFAGIKVDKRVLAQISEELSTGLEKDEENIYALAGSRFNINSPKQLAQVLFEDLGLPGGKKTKSGYSTGQEVLENLADQHEIIPYIIDYRQLSKLKSTYADALQNLIHPDTGRVHTIFKQALTATGRLSSVEPNLQNIPIRMEAGRRIRKAFTAGSKEVLLFTADYSQIDLRALAHISGDETLIDTFRRGIDIHTRTAAEIFDVPLERVDENLRRRAKAVNFGIIYGISDFGLARDTGVSRKEAGRYIEEYLDSYPGVKQYMQDVVEFGIENGYVATALGRRRYLPDLRARNKMVQSFARRMALNTPIQGTSADIIKLAMIKVAETLKHQGLKSRLLLQVHDDLLLEVPRGELEETAAIVKDCMENAYELKVPLIVSMKVGTDWYDMQAWE
ncbi:MAG TPA: DNA polymerase I [Syntrophomonas sp.]|nr:DNA polymerase I [Syntrophomonas sp.]